MAYTAQDVKKLREATAAGRLDCKKALVEAGGDYEKAVELSRGTGHKGVTKSEGRRSSTGPATSLFAGVDGGFLALDG